MTSAALRTEGLVKRFGDHRALAGLDLEVPTGSVFGFLGPNGAGKTTAVRILLGLARPTSGGVEVLGRPPGAAAGAVGYLPDVPGFSSWMTARQTLRLDAQILGLRSPDRRIDMLLDLAGLSGTTTPVGGFSRGMRQRLGLAQALLGAPELLVLDEPTSALDPLGRRAVLDMLVELRGRTTIFFSTHLLADVERVCDTVAIVDHGRVVAGGPLEDLRRRYAGAARFRVQTDAPDVLRRELAVEPWVGSVVEEENALLVAADPDVAAVRLPAVVARAGVGLRRLEQLEPSLEDVFVSVVER